MKDLLTSLGSLHNLKLSQKYPAPRWRLQYPIHQKSYPGKHYSLCPTFFSTSHHHLYNKHFELHHMASTKDKWSRFQAFQHLHKSFKAKPLYQILEQSSSHPPRATISVAELDSTKPSLQTPLNPLPPQFCQGLGFLSWLEPLGQHQAVLSYLTATPGTKSTKNTTGKKAKLEATLL